MDGASGLDHQRRLVSDALRKHIHPEESRDPDEINELFDTIPTKKAPLVCA